MRASSLPQACTKTLDLGPMLVPTVWDKPPAYLRLPLVDSTIGYDSMAPCACKEEART